MTDDEIQQGVEAARQHQLMAARLQDLIKAVADISNLVVAITGSKTQWTAVLTGCATSIAAKRTAAEVCERVGFRVSNRLVRLAAPECEPLVNAALVDKKQGRLDAALAALDSAVSQAPDVPRYLSLRAGVLEAMSQLDAALADCDAALAADSSDGSRFQRCEILFGLGRNDEVWPVLNELLATYEHPEALRLRARMLEQAGDPDAAACDRAAASEIEERVGLLARFWPPRKRD